MTATPYAASMSPTKAYGTVTNSVTWHGFSVTDQARFETFVREKVKPRYSDNEVPFEEELRGLATTGMSSEFLGRFLAATTPPEPWEVGEVLAECIITECTHKEIIWPWNGRRDRRTPRASLPGADLVGFCRKDSAVFLLLGEVKSSSEQRNPPNVMSGGSGMVWQLHDNATRLEIQHTLLKWLRSRCESDELKELYKAAVTKFLESNGKEILVVGVLLRDTQPNELDLKNRATDLAGKLPAPTQAELKAWYFPVSIDQWPQLIEDGGAA